jgi:Caulimovirus viroplasmin
LLHSAIIKQPHTVVCDSSNPSISRRPRREPPHTLDSVTNLQNALQHTRPLPHHHLSYRFRLRPTILTIKFLQPLHTRAFLPAASPLSRGSGRYLLRRGNNPLVFRTPLHTAEPPMSSSASKKRKFGDVAQSTKYYAVKAGHRPGVYNTWAECQANITGFKGASCRF